MATKTSLESSSLCCRIWAKYASNRLVCTDLKQRERRKDSMLFVHVVVKTRKLVILRRCFDECTGEKCAKMRAERAAR